jgi:hypothetical protein
LGQQDLETTVDLVLKEGPLGCYMTNGAKLRISYHEPERQLRHLERLFPTLYQNREFLRLRTDGRSPEFLRFVVICLVEREEPASLKEGSDHSRFDSEVHILRVASDARNLHSVELADHDTNNPPLEIEQRAAAVAWLDRYRHLQQARIVADPRQCAHGPGRHARLGREQPVQGKADGDHAVARTNTTVI